MTRAKWAKLSPEEQRIKVAELCGLTNIGREPVGGMLIGLRSDKTRMKIRDYLNDLNAMHEAEKLLEVYLIHKYCDNVDMIMAEDFVSGMCDINIMATASQRAEAFVLTMEGC